MHIKDVLKRLNTFIDPSDPDLDEDNAIHAYQTAERIRKIHPKNTELQIIGLIHDLGKVLVLPEFGYFPEFFSVGDIYPLGCKFQESNIYYEKKYHTQCSDFLNTQYNTLNGIYKPNCGFDNVAMTFSHDYYLYNILLKSCTKIPVEALYIIRYHSFYGCHTPHNKIRGYTNLANDKDWFNLPCFYKKKNH